jgi:hypothetical protein
MFCFVKKACIIGSEMQVNLRERNSNVVFNKFPVNDPPDIRFDILYSKDIVAEEQQFKIQGRISEINKTSQYGFPVGNLGMLHGTFL